MTMPFMKDHLFLFRPLFGRFERPSGLRSQPFNGRHENRFRRFWRICEGNERAVGLFVVSNRRPEIKLLIFYRLDWIRLLLISQYYRV